MVQSKKFDYSQARAELNEVLEWFESGEADVDKALAQYKRAKALILDIESYLKTVEQSLSITVHTNE